MRRLCAALLTALLIAVVAVPAQAADGKPSRWVLTGASSVPASYWQGLTSDPAQENVFFTGPTQGLWRTDPAFAEEAGKASAIPQPVKTDEGYNHIGDPTWDDADGGRVLLPLECYTPGVGNFCGTGSFGVADPETLAFEYYVKLDTADIAKAMWAETSPDGSLVWTSSGEDLLAYRTADVTRGNAAPSGPAIEPVERLAGAVPPSGITGAVFKGQHNLLLAGEGDDAHQVWSVNTETGESRLVISRSICGESEGLDTIATLSGKLHWLIAPFDPGCELSFGPSSALLHFARSRGHRRYEVEVADVSATVPGTVTARVQVARGDGEPLADAKVSFAGAEARTDESGAATLSTTLQRPGRFKAIARKHGRWGASGLVQAGEPQAPGRRARNGRA